MNATREEAEVVELAMDNTSGVCREEEDILKMSSKSESASVN